MQAAFESPHTVEAAVALLQKHGSEARLVAGGTDLIVQMGGGLRRPSVVVDLKRIDELVGLEITADAAIIGAARSTALLREDEGLSTWLPGLIEAAELIGSEQIQGRASLGGNLCNASPAADTVPALIVNEAVCVIAGPEGRRTLPVADFTTGPGSNALLEGELLVALQVPRPAARTADAYLRFIPRTEMDIAVVGAGVRVTLDADGNCSDARLALGAVGPTALEVPGAADAVRGHSADDAALERIAAAARDAARPIADKRGTVPYRKQVAGVLAKRAFAIAVARAAEQG